MGKINLPSILISGGPMLAGIYKGEKIDLISVFEGIGKLKKGLINETQLKEMEDKACPTAGSCAGMFTANTMNSLAEALGVAPIGNGTIPAVYSERIRLAKYAGMQVIELFKNNLTPRKIVSIKSFYNAVAVDIALGGSTNSVLHLPAIAESFGLKLKIDIFDKLSKKIPQICSLSPVGKHHLEDLYHAGGIIAVMKRLSEQNHINTDAKTVMLKTIGTLIKECEIEDENVIRPFNNPFHSCGGIAILRGNLAKNGAVAKLAGVPESLYYHKGPAVVFEDGESAAEAILSGNIKNGSVIVIRNEGIKGGPGMREMLSPTSALVGMGLENHIAIITDGRFSGGSKGAVIGNVSPEAAENGLIAYVKNNDIIEIDFYKRELNLLLDEKTLTKRLKNKKMPNKK
jgi:dihydroxy-acid dehydratase